MTLLVLSWAALGCAAVPALLYLWNSFLFREPPVVPLPSPLAGEGGGASPPGEGALGNTQPAKPKSGASLHPSPGSLREPPSAARGEGQAPPLSVLIPARNEELGIEACVRSVLASRHVELEVIVLDDASTDRTADIVRALAAEDARVRLEPAPPLPDGWSGKQHACFALSKLAKYDTFTFLDADVRLHPDALARMALFLRESECDLVSGFPRQETGTLLEHLLIPLINWLLLCFLPLWGMRHFRWSAFGAGCGQWFMTSRAAYEKVGGHAAVRTSFHDGLTLPRAYRKAGLWTDICDATNLATCRMYRSASGVWLGLAKNAREGMASTAQIGFWTVMLFCGQVLPYTLVLLLLFVPRGDTLPRGYWEHIAFWSCMFAHATRGAMRYRFHHLDTSWLLHPVAILLLLAVQWYAAVRALVGQPVGWKGRARPITKDTST